MRRFKSLCASSRFHPGRCSSALHYYRNESQGNSSKSLAQWIYRNVNAGLNLLLIDQIALMFANLLSWTHIVDSDSLSGLQRC